MKRGVGKGEINKKAFYDLPHVVSLEKARTEKMT